MASLPIMAAETGVEVNVWLSQADSPALFHDLERSGYLPPGVTGADAALAVLCTLSRRIAGGRPPDFLEGLSAPVRTILTRCPAHLGGAGAISGAEEFSRRVAEHLEIAPDRAEDVVRVVFGALKRWLPEEHVQALEREMPKDLEDLWIHAHLH